MTTLGLEPKLSCRLQNDRRAGGPLRHDHSAGPSSLIIYGFRNPRGSIPALDLQFASRLRRLR